MRNQGNRNPLTSHRFSCYDLCFSASDKKVSLEKKLLELLEERAPGDQGLVQPTPEEEEEVIIKRLRQRMEIPKWKIELVQSYSWPSY